MYSHVHLQAGHQMLIISAFLKFDQKCWQCCTRILKFLKVVSICVQTAAPLLQIEDYDVVASMLAARSSFLTSLDLWRCRNLTDRGLVELINGCRWVFGTFKSFSCEAPKQNPCELVSSHQDAGGVGPGLVPHTPEQHRVFPAPRSRPSSPAQTLPHC